VRFNCNVHLRMLGQGFFGGRWLSGKRFSSHGVHGLLQWHRKPAPQATVWAQYVADREETLHREPPDSKRAWVARDELEQYGPQATAVAGRLNAALHPPGPDPLAVDVARAQLEAARARYQAAVAAGRVMEVCIVLVVGNKAVVLAVLKSVPVCR
jgi:hypothetical protein